MKKVLVSFFCFLFIISLVGCNASNSKGFKCASCGESINEDSKFCSNCGTVVDDGSENNNHQTTCMHVWNEADCLTPKTCSKCGNTDGNALGHTTSTGICDRCNIRQGWTENEVQSLINVYSVFVNEINSAGGVDMKIGWTNTSSKTYKYVHFTVEAYNAVWDKVYCEIGKHNVFTGNITGPIEPGYTNLTYDCEKDKYSVEGLWENCYYNSDVKHLVLTSVEIIYMDNTSVTIDGDAIDYVISDLPQGLTYIWNNELNGYSVEYRLRNNCAETKISIPSTHNDKNIVAIGDYGFSNITTIDSITLPQTLKQIGYSSFANCTNLKNIEIPSNVNNIDSYAFENCSKINSVYIPNNVDTMGYSILKGCQNLDTLSIPFLDDRLVYLFGSDVPTTLKKVELRGGTKLPEEAFQYCDQIVEILLPDTIVSIGESAFSECTQLQHIVIPNKVTSIGRHAFYKCSSLNEIIIPNSVKSIDSIAFVDCINLQKIIIPKSVTEIGYYAFSGCSDVTIYCEAASMPKGWDSDWNYLGYDNGSQYCAVIWGYSAEKNSIEYTLSNDQSYYIVTGIGTFTGDELLIPNTYKGKPVKEIGESAFEYNTSLKSISIPSSIVKIRDSAFYFCKNLESINIPDGVVSIGAWTFKDCSKLVEVVIPSSVTDIGNSVFSGCGSLVNITVDSNNTIYKSISGNLYSKDGKTLIQYAVGKKDTSFRIPETVTSIDDYAFLGCTKLTDVILSDIITSIGWDVFNGCVNLTIYCASSNKQAGWDSDWNYCFEHTNGTDYCTVIWNYVD